VNKRLTFSYPYTLATESRAKQSVTEIKRRFETEDEYSERSVIRTFNHITTTRPQFLKKEKQLTSAEIGTAMHTVMQHIPFDKKWTTASVQQFVQQLVAEEKLTEMEANNINVEAIVTFFDSDLARLLTRYEIQREIPFSYTVDAQTLYTNSAKLNDEKVLIQGVIDCIAFTDEGIILLDYKTDAIREREITDELIEQLTDRYEIQMSLYKQALENILQREVVATYLYFFSKQLTIKV